MWQEALAAGCGVLGLARSTFSRSPRRAARTAGRCRASVWLAEDPEQESQVVQHIPKLQIRAWASLSGIAHGHYNHTMNDDDVRQRLDNITTQWSLVANAHRDGTQAEAVRARQLLVERYQVPIFRYMLSVVKDVELAEDLLQQFAVLVMDGKLQNASPKKGRFRKYVKTVVINLIRQHFRSRKPTVPLSPHLQDGQPVEEDDLFAEHCRHDLLERTFSALGAASPTQSRLLRMRVAIPDATSRELAEKYQQQCQCSQDPATRPRRFRQDSRGRSGGLHTGSDPRRSEGRA